MKKLISIVSSLSVVALLASCGGGGDDGPAAATPTTTTTTAAKYAGTYIGCFPTGATSSRKETLVITAQTAEAATFSFSEVNYAAASCGGAAGTTSTDSGSVAFSGTKTIGSETVDKAIVTQASSAPQKQVFLLRGTGPVLFFSGKVAQDGGPVDSDGYPTTLETNGLTKQ